METRRLGRTEHQSSVLIYGAASLWTCSQEEADASVRAALDAGINHIDTARFYGESEVRLGAMMPEIRDRVFLATKVTERPYEAAWRSINESLERLAVDQVDLLQIHEVNDMATLDVVTGDGGPLAAVVRAQEEGLTRFVGITGHSHDAPVVHREALARFDFDTVLTPYNWVLARNPQFEEDYQLLRDEVSRRDVGLMTIKMNAHRNYVEGDEKLTCWYQPFTEQEQVTAAVAWLLRQPGIAGAATTGETRLLAKILEAERAREGLTDEWIDDVLGSIEDYSSVF